MKHYILSLLAAVTVFNAIMSFVFLSEAFAADNVVTVLDTSVGEDGATQTAKYNFIKEEEFPLIIVCDLSTGDETVFQTKAEAADAWVNVYSWTTGTDEAKMFRPMNLWRVIRSTDGTVGEAVCKVSNIYNQDITAHE